MKEFFAKKNEQLKAFNYFRKRLHHRSSAEFYTHLMYIINNLKTYILEPI